MTTFDPTPERFGALAQEVDARWISVERIANALRAAAGLAREVAELKDAVAKGAQIIEIMGDSAGQREDIITALETRIAAQDAELEALRRAADEIRRTANSMCLQNGSPLQVYLKYVSRAFDSKCR